MTARRHLPVRPDLDRLHTEAESLLRALQQGDPAASAEMTAAHPDGAVPSALSVADAQDALARSYGVAGWPRLVLACRMTDAIWRDDLDTVRALVDAHPTLLAEDARGVKGNWGPPMSYAANLGRDRIVAMLHARGAGDVSFAFDRACLQGQLDTARLLYQLGARPEPGSIMGPCETLNGAGLGFLLGLEAPFSDSSGDRLAPVALMLQTYSRHPEGKHECLELAVQHGVDLPDTPAMALHRGRLDLLRRHLQADPGLLARTFTHEEIYPPSLGCDADHSLALHATPLDGTTLLHMAIDFDESGVVEWLLSNGVDVNVQAAVDDEGFGGHTPLFHTVVVQSVRQRQEDRFAQLLVGCGADPNRRASLRKQLRGAEDETLHEYRNVTPVQWGRRFHDERFVSRPAIAAIEAAGGHE